MVVPRPRLVYDLYAIAISMTRPTSPKTATCKVPTATATIVSSGKPSMGKLTYLHGSPLPLVRFAESARLDVL